MRIGDEMKKAMTYDAAEFLETDEDIVAYLNAALEDGDPALVSAALGDIARARGMTQLAKDTGITRDGLYKALSPTGNPSFSTVQKVVKALGYKLGMWPCPLKSQPGKRRFHLTSALVITCREAALMRQSLSYCSTRDREWVLPV